MSKRRVDLVKTGYRIKYLVKTAGYSVNDIQEYLGLSCPQCIYRWFKGKILPSVEHLYALSVLLKVHMEELLVVDVEYDNCLYEKLDVLARKLRLEKYSEIYLRKDWKLVQT